MMEIDQFDRAIINIIQQDNSLSMQGIGEMVGLSAPSVQRRIARLKSTGVISAEVALVDIQRLGNFITIITEIELIDTTMEIERNFMSLVHSIPFAQQCYIVSGEIDFIIISSVQNMQIYDVHIRKVIMDNVPVKRLRTFVSMNNVKQSLNVKI